MPTAPGGRMRDLHALTWPSVKPPKHVNLPFQNCFEEFVALAYAIGRIENEANDTSDDEINALHGWKFV